VPSPYDKELEQIFSACRSIIDSNTWNRIVEACGANPEPNTFLNTLVFQTEKLGLPKYLPDLASLEKSVYETTAMDTEPNLKVERVEVNPTVQLLELSWQNLTTLLDLKNGISRLVPAPDQEFVLVWSDPENMETKVKVATDEDLLVLKIMVEGIDPEEVASESSLPVVKVDLAIDRAIERGILIRPKSRICRDPGGFSAYKDTNERFLSSPTFAIQWHITQACDLHCKHCYDRSNRSVLRWEKAMDILNDLQAFCRERYVKGHVIFTGGNPLLYPKFLKLYRAASERGFVTALLGNPASRAQIQELIAIQRLRFFQVSLEGLPDHNDMIRGKGHFGRVIEFLKILRDLGVYSMVMLTLTKDNIDQVLPLADMLRKHTDSFFFNRLSMVGEGANLQLPTSAEYANFLQDYMDASANNPIMGLKDNLFNVLLHQKGMPLFSGCTGYGCGAAFSFITVLSDGEVHACRKFPSPIGNIYEQSIAEIYDSEIARQYRAGCEACDACVIRPVCGGCLAISHSYGLNVFKERDPHCFMKNNS